MIAYGCELEFWDEILLRREECKTRKKKQKKTKILNLAKKGKMVILSEWDRLKPVIFLDL